MRIRLCGCGMPFDRRSNRQCYCPDCKRKIHNQQTRDWWARNRAKPKRIDGGACSEALEPVMWEIVHSIERAKAQLDDERRMMAEIAANRRRHCVVLQL